MRGSSREVAISFSDYDIDLGQFRIFQTLFRLRSVTDTAHALDLSQPAVSRKLAKLRDHFEDQLFVRTGKGLVPTPLAIELEPRIGELMSIFQMQMHHHREFDPATSKRKFVIASSEVGHKLILPGLIETFSGIAPNIRIVAARPASDTLMNELEEGAVDVAVGAYPKLYSGIYEKTLSTESYVCIARKEHPDISGEMTAQSFLNAGHVIVSTKGMGHIHRQIEARLIELCPRENIKVIADSFVTAALLVESTDYIAALPNRLVNMLRDRIAIQVLQPPIDLPNFDIKIYWHERFQNAPANQWLRQTISRIIR